MGLKLRKLDSNSFPVLPLFFWIGVVLSLNNNVFMSSCYNPHLLILDNLLGFLRLWPYRFWVDYSMLLKYLMNLDYTNSSSNFWMIHQFPFFDSFFSRWEITVSSEIHSEPNCSIIQPLWFGSLYFWMRGNSILESVFCGPSERVKSQLFHSLIRDACPDSNSFW